MIAVGEAVERLLSGLAPTAEVEVGLADLPGATLARDVIAGFDWPIERRATMDGVALSRPSLPSYRLVGTASAGAPFGGTLEKGCAIRIATGAVVPEGAERVVPIEQVTFAGEEVEVRFEPSDPLFIRPAGSDFRQREVLLAAGQRLNAGTIGLIAAANQPTAWVRSPPNVTIISSGDELVEPGDSLVEGSTVDSARFTIAALARAWGARVTMVPRLADRIEETEARLAVALAAADLVVTIGGASVGERDHLRPAARALHMEMAFEKVAVQPGKPSWHARSAEGMILGLPGNPASAFVCAHLFLRPFIDRKLGRGAAPRWTARLAGRSSAGGRELYQRGRLQFRDGEVWAQAAQDPDSGLQAQLAWADCLIRIPAGARVDEGELVQVIPIDQ